MYSGDDALNWQPGKKRCLLLSCPGSGRARANISPLLNCMSRRGKSWGEGGIFPFLTMISLEFLHTSPIFKLLGQISSQRPHRLQELIIYWLCGHHDHLQVVINITQIFSRIPFKVGQIFTGLHIPDTHTGQRRLPGWLLPGSPGRTAGTTAESGSTPLCW